MHLPIRGRMKRGVQRVNLAARCAHLEVELANYRRYLGVPSLLGHRDASVKEDRARELLAVRTSLYFK